MFLFTYIFPDSFLIQANGIHTVPTSPKLSPEKASLGFHQLPMNTHSTLTFQVSHRHRDAIPERNRQVNDSNKYDLMRATTKEITQLRAELRIHLRWGSTPKVVELKHGTHEGSAPVSGQRNTSARNRKNGFLVDFIRPYKSR